MKTLIDFGTIDKPYNGSWKTEPKKDARWYGMNKSKNNRVNKRKY
jgi:hypothetical protein